MRTARRVLALLAIAVLVLGVAPTMLHAQQKATVRIMGVFDDATGQPVVGAEVVDISSNTKAVTSDAGMIPLTWLAQGTTILQIRKVGYTSKMIPVSISPADTEPITVILKPVGTTLPEVVTKATSTTAGKMSEFERRRAIGMGKFLTQEEIEKHQTSRTADVLLMLGGIHIVHPRNNSAAAYVAVNRVSGSLKQGMADCLAGIVLDGATVYSANPGEQPFDINTIAADQIAGVEVYSGGASIPPEYNATRASCALVIIWTR
jgi:hypothetical protein